MSFTEETSAPTAAELPVAGLFAQIAKDIREGEFDLPGFPEAVLRIQRKIDSPDSSAEDIVKILSTEPSLAARTLQIANSALFRGDHEVTDLRTAVSRLGFSLVRSLAIAFAIQQLRFRSTFSIAARSEIEAIWSLQR
jgi:HD-like signal output (HDOD) protein